MASLQEIQAQVNQAQEEIRNHNFDHVRRVIWPNIKIAIGENSELMWGDRQKLARLIYEHLDTLPLREEANVPIDVSNMVRDIQAGNVPELAAPTATMWLLY